MLTSFFIYGITLVMKMVKIKFPKGGGINGECSGFSASY